MAGITTALLVGGLALTAAGTAVSYVGQKKQTAALKRGEDARAAQMKLDSMRQRREVVRQGILARSVSLFNTSSQGAQSGSALPGAYGQIAGQTGRNLNAINQNEQIGGELFAANQSYYNASGITSFGAGMTSLGQAVVNNLGPIERLSNFAMGRRGAPSSAGRFNNNPAPFGGGLY